MGEAASFLIEENGSRENGFGCAEELDKRLDGLDADIHERAGGHRAIEDVGVLPGENFVVAR